MNEDLSNLFEKFNINKDSISPEMIDSIMGIVNNNENTHDNKQNSKSNTSKSDNSSSSIDFDTLMRMKNIMDKMNSQDNPRSKLLLSLKPYLKNERKNKIDQYIQLSKIIEILPFIGGDNSHGTK